MEGWRRNLAILWGTQFLAMAGMNLVVPFLPFYVRSLGVTDPADLALWSGLAFSGTFFAAFVATPFWGSMGDRYGRKAMVVRAIWGLGISQILIGLSQNAFQLVLFRIVQGIISGFIASALALVSTNTPKERIGYAIGILQSATSAGMVLGPFVGGVLADLIGFRAIFFVTASLCIIGGFVVLGGVQELVKGGGEEKAYSVFSNFRLMFTDPRLRMVAAGLVIGQMAVLMVEPLFALFIEGFGSPTAYLATLAGGIVSIAGLFMVVSAPWWGRRNDRVGYRRNMMLAFAVTAAAYAGHALVTDLVQLGALRALLGFFRGGILPALYALTSLHSPADRRGGMMAIASSLTLFGNMLGPTLGGVVAGQFGMYISFFVVALLLVGLSLLFRRFPEAETGAGPLPEAAGRLKPEQI